MNRETVFVHPSSCVDDDVTIGLITYQCPHLKTEQIILQLVGHYDLRVYALPFVSRPPRTVQFQHRPDQKIAAHPQELCLRYRIPYIPVSCDTEIDNLCDFYMVTGAGLLSAECLCGKKVLNGHPGIIPAARGLDAFKWSVYHMRPLGVTLHYIDEQVDAGEIISIIPTPVFRSDSLESLARRHYENEIRVLCEFEKHMKEPQNSYTALPVEESTRRMKSEQELELFHRFEEYKQKFGQ